MTQLLSTIRVFILFIDFFFLMIRRPPRSTRLTHSFPTRRSSDLMRVACGSEQGRRVGDRPRLPMVGAHPVGADRIAVLGARIPLVAGPLDRKSTRLNSSH